MVNGNIMRTVTRSSLGFVPRGTSFGSKSDGMYLFRTLRSPMIYDFNKYTNEYRIYDIFVD
jgi:hypothetical protein